MSLATRCPACNTALQRRLPMALAETASIFCETLLFEQALILDGELPHDPAAFASRLNRLVVRALPVAE